MVPAFNVQNSSSCDILWNQGTIQPLANMIIDLGSPSNYTLI